MNFAVLDAVKIYFKKVTNVSLKKFGEIYLGQVYNAVPRSIRKQLRTISARRNECYI